MKISPYISVIIPNYNHARFLDERIQSVMNQTYQNFEVIILDDKSTDNSVEVINKYKDNPHVSQIVINEENSGSPFKQWHKGFELAKGEWIWIAESDDSCEPLFLETLTRFVDNEASFIFCRSKRIGGNGEPVEDHWQDVLKDTFTIEGKTFIEKFLLERCVVWNASSVIFRRQFAMQLNHDYMDFKGGGDWLFWLFLSNKGNVTFEDTPLNYFRLHGQNTTQKTISCGDAHREKIRIYQTLAKYNIIDKSEYNALRQQDIYRVCLYEKPDSIPVAELMDLWCVSIKERISLWIKKHYIRMRYRK